MSVGKTCNDGNISIFTQDCVTVHKEHDFLITCRANPFLLACVTSMAVTASHSPNTKATGNLLAPLPRKPASPYNAPTASMTYLPPNKPSSGCTPCVGTLSNPPGPSLHKHTTSSAGHCLLPRTSKSITPTPQNYPRSISTKCTRIFDPPSPSLSLSKLSTLPISKAPKFATSSPKSTMSMTPSSPIKLENSPSVPNLATSTSWSSWKSTPVPYLSKPLKTNLIPNSLAHILCPCCTSTKPASPCTTTRSPTP
ncbi:hypothetical protein ACHAW6_005141 [Cyclotella cf. meneghiniana]